MTTRARILPHYTYDDYVLWKGRWEVIDGIPFAMSPSPSPQHQKIANRIGVHLTNQLDAQDCQCQVYQPIDLRIKDDVVLQPDLLVVCDEIVKPYLDFPPRLIVEILSPSTRQRDQNTKFDLYEEFGIHCYLIVDPESHELRTYQLDGSKRYAEKNRDLEIELDADCNVSLQSLSSVLFS